MDSASMDVKFTGGVARSQAHRFSRLCRWRSCYACRLRSAARTQLESWSRRGRRVSLQLMSHVRALSEARFHRRVGRSKVLWRAFDKAVRTKPPAVAADAGLMEIQLREGTVSRCPGVVRRSAD